MEIRRKRPDSTPGPREWFTGQVLHVTEGAGLVQSRGGAAEVIRAGDTVQAAAGEWHWHGAGPGTFMTHLAVQEAGADGQTSEWGEHVTDEEYRG